MVQITRRDGLRATREYDLNENLISVAESNERLINAFIFFTLLFHLTLICLISYYYDVTYEKPLERYEIISLMICIVYPQTFLIMYF